MTSSETKTKENVSHGWAITLFTIGVFMAGLDNGIISTALTTISDAFDVSASWSAWSVTLYTLGTAISVPIVGKLSDRYGRRKLFLIGITIFGIGSLLVAFSPNFIFLIMARFIQSLGGGGIFIIGTSYILATVPKNKQGKALGLLGGMHGLSAVAGPNLGALIYNLTGTWQWMFLINIPIAIFLVGFGYFKIAESTSDNRKPMDLFGSVVLGLATLSLMLGITNIGAEHSLSSFVILFILLGILLFVFFVRHEGRLEKSAGDPLISYHLLKKPKFQLTLLLGLLSGGFLAGIIFIPSFVQQVLGVEVQSAGYWLTPMAVASGIGAGAGGVLTDKIGSARTVTIAGVLGIVGFFSFPFIQSGVFFIFASTLAGIGLGMLLGAPLNVLVGESASENEAGSAVGTLSLVRQIGLTLFPTIYAGFLVGTKTKVGYSQLYTVAGSLSILVFIVGLYLVIRKQNIKI